MGETKSFVGCLAHFALMAGLTWAVVIGTGVLIWTRWCKP